MKKWKKKINNYDKIDRMSGEWRKRWEDLLFENTILIVPN